MTDKTAKELLEKHAESAGSHADDEFVAECTFCELARRLRKLDEWVDRQRKHAIADNGYLNAVRRILDGGSG